MTITREAFDAGFERGIDQFAWDRDRSGRPVRAGLTAEETAELRELFWTQIFGQENQRAPRLLELERKHDRGRMVLIEKSRVDRIAHEATPTTDRPQ